MNYTEAQIQETLDHLVAEGRIIQVEDGYYPAPGYESDRPHVSKTQGRVLHKLIEAFDMAPGDTFSFEMSMAGKGKVNLTREF
jgi:hypothetical protein